MHVDPTSALPTERMSVDKRQETRTLIFFTVIYNAFAIGEGRVTTVACGPLFPCSKPKRTSVPSSSCLNVNPRSAFA